MCQKSHDISINNLKNNDIITHELLLLRGKVQKKCTVSEITIIETRTIQSKKFKVSLTGEFKIIWLLTNSTNQFSINYCHSNKQINVYYEKLNPLYTIQPIYIICKNHNGCFQSSNEKNTISDACKLITLGIKIVQCIYSEKILEACPFQTRKTFTLQSDCIPFYSSLEVKEANEMDEIALWNKFAFEAINSKMGENPNIKFVAFIACTSYEGIVDGNYTYSNIKKHTKAHAALGVGGLALFGSAGLYTWPDCVDNIIPCFEDETLLDLKHQWDESNYRRTYGGCFASTLGSVCHEIGHIFDLGHTKEGIMGNGFDYVNRIFTISDVTEVLPNRIVGPQAADAKDNRLTRLRKPDGFLSKYHEQKTIDGTFFASSCALILYHHKWLNNNHADVKRNIHFNWDKLSLTSDDFIKVVEVREKTNSLVIRALEYSRLDKKVVVLPEDIDYQTCDIFVITINGTSKLFT